MEQTARSEPHTLIQKSGFAPRRQYNANNNSVDSENVTNRPSQTSQKTAEPIRKSRHKQVKDVDESTVSAPVCSKISVEEKQPPKDSKGIKTPVSILQEFLSRRGITPTYELVQIEGAIHEPTFRYRVSYNNRDEPITAMGAGRSKKEAKHAAARALIEKTQNPDFGSLNIGSHTILPNMCEGNGTTIGGGDGADSVLGNPIGWLQELCMSSRWPPPTYNTETEVGLPHERLFTIACSILSYREIGKGKSKKIAKRQAAHKMLVRLKNNPLDNGQINEAIQFELNAETRNNADYYSDLKDFPINTITTQHSAKVSQFPKMLKNSTGKKLLKLQKTCLSNSTHDFMKELAEIANENQFEATYVHIDEKTMSNMFQCLVQLSTLPVAVCHGTGKSAEEAQHQAARNALEYLQIMTKK
ncbi:interferon-inducible double-stranded RNA-dependent protein kinase activator A homolog [Teleopsis dalmanni]|uniref:interferon-inducible double-stranded RNA-dependent protein kinase activator A homolog n=1 Tax=Teleopsis dalmanni TaxID=139649 RepID=UPI0018CCB941|nr:interferon-inducible double-stranded RNA-dependent protein kinase activator A homolog [Teleopsis dalmanni]